MLYNLFFKCFTSINYDILDSNIKEQKEKEYIKKQNIIDNKSKEQKSISANLEMIGIQEDNIDFHSETIFEQEQEQEQGQDENIEDEDGYNLDDYEELNDEDNDDNPFIFNEDVL